MEKSYYLNFGTLVTYAQMVLQYCAEHSDSFSLVTIVCKPYSQTPLACEHEQELQCLASYFVREGRCTGVAGDADTCTSLCAQTLLFV
jgi:hypothetical protein